MTRKNFLNLLSILVWKGISSDLMAKDLPANIPKREIPSTGEKIPVLGLGTWKNFDLFPNEGNLNKLFELIRAFRDQGGKLIDSSPMYGKAEDNIGLLKQKFPDLMENTFLATKVWTNGKKEGLAQIDSSFKKLNSDIIDLFQVHNLLDTETQMNTLREFRAKGFIRYLGITHYVASEFKRVEMFMKKEKVDFIQIPYSIFVRQAEDRLLAEAKDRKIAVIVNRPFEGGDVFDKFKNKPLDERLVKMGFESWAEVFMRFILAHPVVTCVLFASSNPTHVTENMNSAKKPTLTRQEADEAYNICKEYL